MKRRLIIAMLLATTLGSWAQQTITESGTVAMSGDTISINLNDAINIALNENPTIKIANSEIERQNYVRKETVGNLIPSLSATGQYSYNMLPQVMFLPVDVFGPGTGGAMRMGFANSFTGGLSLSVPLFVPTIYKTLELNEQQMLEAVEKARSSKIELSTQVKKAVYQVLLTESSLKLIIENIALAQEVVDNSQNAYNQGVVSQYDLITSQVQLSNLNPSLYAAQSANYNSRLMLNMLLGLPLQTNVDLQEELLSYVEHINEHHDFTIDLSNNADLELLNIQGNMLESQLKIQKTLNLPTLAAFGSYQILTQSNDLKIGSYDWQSTAMVGLQLEVPIFAGMTKVNKQKQIINQQGQLETQREYLEESLSVEAQAAVSNILSAKRQMEANRLAGEQAESGYKIAVTRYESGMGTIVEVNQAQVQLIQADMNYQEAIYNYMVAKADFDKTIGYDI